MMKVTFLLYRDRIELYSVYDAELVAYVKKLPVPARRWVEKSKCWSFPTKRETFSYLSYWFMYGRGKVRGISYEVISMAAGITQISDYFKSVVDTTTHYKALGLEENASQDTIKSAFRTAVRKFHPDVGGDSDAFIAVNSAYQTLGDPQKRKRYDAALAVVRHQ